MRYTDVMRKTTLAIDDELVRRAAEVLGTDGLKATVDGALHEVIAAEARRRFTERLRTMKGLDLDQPDVMAGAWR
jgi:Arc/MetJ family transcription regulator